MRRIAARSVAHAAEVRAGDRPWADERCGDDLSGIVQISDDKLAQHRAREHLPAVVRIEGRR